MTIRAAIYARKSTDDDRHAEAKSVTRQVEEGRRYAREQGWTVDDANVYVDDGVSGAYGADRRPGLKALLSAAEATPRPFDVVIMAKDDRLMREQFQAAIVLSRLRDAGVRLFYYLDDREVDLSNAVGKFMESVRGFGSEIYRESVTAHMVDSLKRRAKSGYVHGGRTFGYDNIRVDGHVERRVNETEARVVRRIFTEYAAGKGLRGIAKLLNSERLPAPRPSKGGPAGWSASTVKDLLKRELYSGRVVSQWGSEEFRIERPDLRIVSGELWGAVQQRRQQAAKIYLRGTGGKLWGK